MNASTKSLKRSLADILAEQEKERGITPLPLEKNLLLKRVKDGGFSGDYLAQAFISAYLRTEFNYSLGDLIKLDAEGFRLFHQILHIRFVPGWRDDVLSSIYKKIKSILEVDTDEI